MMAPPRIPSRRTTGSSPTPSNLPKPPHRIARTLRTGSLATLLFLAATPPAPAAEFTLAEVIDRAIARSYDLEASEHKQEITRARIEDSRSWLASNPYFSFSYWDSTDKTVFSDGRTQGIGPSYTVSLSQTFEIAGQRGKRIEIAHNNDAVASANTDSARHSFVVRVERAFNETLEAHEKTQLAFELLHWQRELHKAYRKSSETDRNESLIRISRAESDYHARQHELFIQETRMRQILDLPPDEPLALVGEFPQSILQLPEESALVDFALQHRADLAAHKAALASDDAFVSLTRRSAVPNVTFSGFLSHADGDDFGDEFQFGGSVTVPVPAFRGSGPRIDEAIADRERARAELNEMERTVRRDVREARYACLVAANDVVRVRDTVVPLARKNVELQDAAFDAGKAGIWELVNAEIDLIQARREQLSALRIYANSLVELERSIGDPLEDAIAAIEARPEAAASAADSDGNEAWAGAAVPDEPTPP